MTAPGLLDGDTIRLLVAEVADELVGGTLQRTIIVVGGSLLAWQGLRESTADVDSIRKLDEETRAAVRAVAQRRGLDVGWLNDSAAPYAPQTLDIDECAVLFEHPCLRVLGLPLREVFLMKLWRADPQDLEDLRTMWPHVCGGFANARAVVHAFEAAFPAATDDPYRAHLLVDELARGGHVLPHD